jgi:hypothetical protein
MSIKGIEEEMSNYAEFKSAVQKYGFSLNNFYDIKFEITEAVPLHNQLVANNLIDLKSNRNLMRLYTDEATLPGLQLSTSEYRVTNTPTLKYVYGAVFSEATFSFIMDADATIKSIFDVWTNWIYGYSLDMNSGNNIADILQLRDVSTRNKFRTRYRDDYAIDITIIKYERAMSSDKNSNVREKPSFSLRDIIPDSTSSVQGSKFYKAIPVYAVKLFKAFPANISSIALNSGTSELSKLSVGFEYETYTTTALNAGRATNWIDTVNDGTGDRAFDIFNLF